MEFSKDPPVKIEFPAGTEPPFNKLKEMMAEQARNTIERELLIIGIENCIAWEWWQAGYLTKEEFVKISDHLHDQEKAGLEAWMSYGFELLNYSIVASLGTEKMDNHDIRDALTSHMKKEVATKQVDLDSEMGCCYFYGTKKAMEKASKFLKELLPSVSSEILVPREQDPEPHHIPLESTWSSAEKTLKSRFGILKESFKPGLLQKYGIPRTQQY